MDSVPFENIEHALERALERDGEIMVSTAGYSMYPMLRNRKDVSVIRTPDRPFKKSDVPVYRLKSGKLVMHRIIAVKDGRYIIRGDNLLKKELGVTDGMIIGRLVAFYRNGKHYDCEKSKRYKLYVFITMHTFAFRFVWKKWLRPFLSKVKRMFK